MKCFYHNDLDGRCAGSLVSIFTSISETYGGGGHKGAAGFQSSILLFTEIKEY